MRTVRLMTCGSSYEAQQISDLLAEHGVSCAIHNLNMSALFGFLTVFQDVDIFVYEDELEMARGIVESNK